MENVLSLPFAICRIVALFLLFRHFAIFALPRGVAHVLTTEETEGGSLSPAPTRAVAASSAASLGSSATL